MTRHAAYVARLFPPDPPQPVPGCEVCAQLAEDRDEAAHLLDRSAVSDANVVMREHQERAHP